MNRSFLPTLASGLITVSALFGCTGPTIVDPSPTDTETQAPTPTETATPSPSPSPTNDAPSRSSLQQWAGAAQAFECGGRFVVSSVTADSVSLVFAPDDGDKLEATLAAGESFDVGSCVVTAWYFTAQSSKPGSGAAWMQVEP